MKLVGHYLINWDKLSFVWFQMCYITLARFIMRAIFEKIWNLKRCTEGSNWLKPFEKFKNTLDRSKIPKFIEIKEKKVFLNEGLSKIFIQNCTKYLWLKKVTYLNIHIDANMAHFFVFFYNKMDHFRIEIMW